MSKDPFEEKNDEPWDEFTWEEFLWENDERADKLGRIIERFGDDPNLDDIIAQEMGWDKYLKPGDTKNEDQEGSAFFFDGEDDDGGEEWKTAAGIRQDEDEGRGVNTDELYVKAFSLSIEAHDWAKSLPGRLRGLSKAADMVSNLAIPAAKCAAAFGDEVL